MMGLPFPNLRLSLAAAALATLASCGNEAGLGDELDAVGAVLRTAKVAYSPVIGPPPQSIFDVGTPEQVIAAIEPFPGQLKVMFLPKAKQSGLLLAAGGNRDVEYWGTPSGQSLALKQGILIATRGMNFDLMSMDVGEAPDLIRRRATGNTNKVYRYLDGEDHEVELYAKCTVSPRGPDTVTLTNGSRVAATKMRETCIAGRLTFNNFFWVASDGRIARSEQFSSPETGQIVIEELRN